MVHSSIVRLIVKSSDLCLNLYPFGVINAAIDFIDDGFGPLIDFIKNTPNIFTYYSQHNYNQSQKKGKQASQCGKPGGGDGTAQCANNQYASIDKTQHRHDQSNEGN